MSLESDIDALKQAQPAWRAEGVGVRGNPVDFQREQAQVDWPAASFTRRSGRDLAGPAKAGVNEIQRSTPAA